MRSGNEKSCEVVEKGCHRLPRWESNIAEIKCMSTGISFRGPTGNQVEECYMADTQIESFLSHREEMRIWKMDGSSLT